MTVLEDGEAKKSDYRMFKIKGRESNPTSLQLREMGDTGALREVLERRFKHNEWPFPSLIVMDGGVAQLNVGEEVIKNLNLNIPVVAVTKDERHKAKKIIGASREALTYEKHILLSNSEAHRFAISFHRRLRDSIKKF
jgi:excinuclease ABC subunit C